MRIGLLTPSVYMSLKKYQDMIFAPRDLARILVDGLVKRGHDVYFFTTSDTKTNANIIAGDEDMILEDYIEEKMAVNGKLDIIHSYHDTLAHYFNDLTGFPTIYPLHDPLPVKKTSINFWLLNKYFHHNYVSISNSFRRSENLRLNFIDTVYHGIDIAKYKSVLRSE